MNFNVSGNITTVNNEVLKLYGGTPLGGEGGTVEQLAKYAAAKSIKLALWYNYGSAHNTVTEQPRDIIAIR